MSVEPVLLPKCKILFHWLCQFGVSTCVKELGGEVFFLTEEGFHPCQHVDFVQKNMRGKQEMLL